ncbi:MAG TPA: hypothetical protein VGI12_19975 [Vicinamibacterales bacterium]|jgi:hypothetical protein
MPRRTTSALVPLLLLALASSLAGRPAATLPAALTDREFWSLLTQLSEPNGSFVSRSGSPDNLLSNEMQVSTVAAALAAQVPAGGVYLGVGPEQNFSYIAATKPRIAFITDIRRGNLDLHLLYKAIFEMSNTRAEFVARLFGRTLVTTLPRQANAAQLMAAYANAAPMPEATFTAHLTQVLDLLATKHGFPLTAEDRASIEHAYRAYHEFGPAIDYTSTIGRRGRFVTYADLMTSVDSQSGRERGFLARDESFALIKTMESRNLIVPVVGDFAGGKALRSVGTWLSGHGAIVSVFYVSNVEQYLEQNGVWPAFCANAATLPVDRSSIFIRPGRGGSSFSPIAAETAHCASK